MKIVRTRKQIPTGIARKLWVQSAGRCQYSGCNVSLWKDDLMYKDMNKAYISHIVAASPAGPRGDEIKSKELEVSYDNLMLLCDECHNRIDESDRKNHSVELLMTMKEDHEHRINLVTGIECANRSLVVSYLGKVGSFYPVLNRSKAFETIIPAYFPFKGYFIQGGTKNSPIDDHEEIYWSTEPLVLERWYNQNVMPFLNDRSSAHISLFAIAPQPLLIKLGSLVSELQPADIFQYFRDPSDSWKWQEDSSDLRCQVVPPVTFTGLPVLKLELSAELNDERIKKVFGEEQLSIWTVRISDPRRDFLKSRVHMQQLKRVFRSAFDQINVAHPDHKQIHVFPIAPNSAAIEFGRVRMPKADKELVLYDQNNKNNSFIKTLIIS
ncbi:hypothetical protein SAMN04487898_12282 [Pedobacter sp. ok626]|uniref:HNH endonuclease n=1 Tax=Pedobacter sp. ok626 TaxID=1761882 RepID=UPI00088D36AD|nr:HNH endonuclease [Pedobacter sp. ok626]SDL67315.1 hypothetical protein SAMN04487898_12282 [Pedobacter sp. ok626]